MNNNLAKIMPFMHNNLHLKISNQICDQIGLEAWNDFWTNVVDKVIHNQVMIQVNFQELYPE